MRVTSTIKGYITSTVKDIYQTKIDSVKVEYDKRRADCISDSIIINLELGKLKLNQLEDELKKIK